MTPLKISDSIRKQNLSYYISYFLHLSYFAFLASTIFSWRAISSISLLAILLASFVKNQTEEHRLLNKRLINTSLIGCALFYLMQFTALLYTDDIKQGWAHLQLKIAIIAIPLALCSSYFLNRDFYKKIMRQYIYLLIAAMVYCLGYAFLKYHRNPADSSVFVYHHLVSPVLNHAVHFSILTFLGLAFLLETFKKGSYLVNGLIHCLILIFFIVFIILLSSKLVISFSAAYFLFYILKSTGTGRGKTKSFYIIAILALFGISVVLFTKNPISSRFNDIITGDVKTFLKQDKFKPGDYFNGIQFRLLEWRFVIEILNENNAWFVGVAPGDAQHMLDQKYIAANMYIGEDSRGDRGYQGYNTHNQLLESALQTGILGLVSFLVIMAGWIQMAVKRKSQILSAFLILLILYVFNESLMETQYGIEIAIFFPLFIYYGVDKPTANCQPANMPPRPLITSF